MAHEWDADRYDRLELPHLRWGRQLLDELALCGDETVLEAGAGTGRDAEQLLARLPRGRVVAVDASQAMLDRLATRLEGERDRLTVHRADLSQPLPALGPVDAIVSVATFHWIVDHARLFANLAAVARPGARLAFECGGAGNIEAVRGALEAVAPRWDVATSVRPWRFAQLAPTRDHLDAAGWDVAHAELVSDPVSFDEAAGLESYLATVVLGAHLDQLVPTDRPAFVRAVAEALEAPTVDYVRLRVHATRRDVAPLR